MIYQADARSIPMIADKSVQCIVTLEKPCLPWLLVELSFAKLAKDYVCLICKFGRHSLKSGLSYVRAGWRVLAAQGIKFKAQFGLSSFALKVGKRGAQKFQAFLLDNTESVVGKSPSTSRAMYDLGSRKQRIYEIYGLPIRHSQLKFDHVGRRAIAGIGQYSLNANMTLRIDHPSQIAKLPRFESSIVRIHRCTVA